MCVLLDNIANNVVAEPHYISVVNWLHCFEVLEEIMQKNYEEKTYK
jgi:hypothetical protein